MRTVNIVVGWDWQTYLNSLGVREIGSVSELQNERNEVVRLRTNGGRELLLKRGKKRLPNGDGTLLNEGLAYMALHELSLSQLGTRCILHDRKNDVLLLDYVEGRNLRDAWGNVGEDVRFWASLGSFLAGLHSGTSDFPEWAGRLLGNFKHLVPSSDPIAPGDLVVSTNAQLQLLAAIQLDEAVKVRLEEIKSPARKSLIHGDLRLDNLLLDSHGAIKLIDFELCGVGDPIYDLGCQRPCQTARRRPRKCPLTASRTARWWP